MSRQELNGSQVRASGSQERLPDATDHLSERFLLAGGQRNLYGNAHGIPDIACSRPCAPGVSVLSAIIVSKIKMELLRKALTGLIVMNGPVQFIEGPISLKIAAYCGYLAAWLAFALAAVAGALPRLRRQAAATTAITAPVLIGTLLQVLAAFAITKSMGSGPLRPRTFELAGALVLAPLGAALFVWALRSVPRDAEVDTLITEGAYSWLRNPIYLAFLAMLVATGLLVSGGVRLILPVLLYVTGTELRIAAEERELAEKFTESYARYRRRTRWRYLPGLR
jgi:protein-S-isoprenylcysteine O-methyltransferase Ste14